MLIPLIISLLPFGEPLPRTNFALTVPLNPINIRVRECIAGIVGTYSQQEGAIIIIARIYADGEIKISPFEIPLYLIRAENFEIPENYKLHKDVLLIITSLSIPGLLKKIPWNHRSKFIVIPRDEREVPLIFRDFWVERILNVVIFKNNKENTQIFTYFPHRENKCSRVALISEVGVCDDVHKNLTDLYPKKVSNMHGCPLKTTIVIRPPYTVETLSGEIVGVEVDLLKTIAHSMNAKPVFEVFSNRIFSNRYKGQNPLMLELTEKLSDVIAGSLMYTESVSTYSGAAEYFESQCVTFAVPKARFSAEYAIRNHISRTIPFIVLTIVSGVLMTPCFWYFMRRQKIHKPLNKSIETVLSPLIGAFIKAPKNLKLSFIISAWLLYCFIFWKYLEADVSSHLIAPPALKELETLKEVLDTDITVSGESFLLSEILPRYMTKKRKAHSAIDPWDVSRALEAIALYRNLSYFGTYSNMMHTLSLNPQFQNMVHIQKKCAAMYSPVIQTETDSPYLEEITKRVYALTEFGITRKLFKQSLDEIKEKIARQAADSAFSPMNLQRISSAFAILIFGLSSACFCFLVEILVFKFKKNRKKPFIFHVTKQLNSSRNP